MAKRLPQHRAPGEKAMRTDEQLLRFNGNLRNLSPEEKKRRTYLKAKARNTPKRRRIRARAQSQPNAIRGAMGNKAAMVKAYGECCRDKCTQPRLPESDLCIVHQPKLSAKKLRAPQVMAEVVEVAVAEFLKPYFSAVGLEFLGFDLETDEPVVRRLEGRAGLGITLHGESKDGDIVMTEYPNVAAQVQVLEKLMDRIYGRAKQAVSLEGGSKPIQMQPVRTAERAQKVADLLARSKAVPPHDGRQRRSPGSSDVSADDKADHASE